MSEALELLETACDLISSAGPGSWDDLPQAWRDAAEKWRERYLALVKDSGTEAPEPPLPEGRYGRVELPGYRHHTGWITDETRYGAQMAVVRDWDGRELAAAVIGPNSQVVYPPTPLRRPEPRPALGAAPDGWDSPEDDAYDDRDDEGGPF